MSYQVIARKWRPQSFDEVSGQGHVTTALRNAIRSERIPHAILLTGPRGVGKTTLARLIARCLNCEKGPTDEPCGSCVPCTEITEGRSTDVQEIDAASRTGVDDIREVIESIRYAAAPGRHRIFIIDEVHMLSSSAFNALLKTLEEPPPRSLFIFATTNPEKIPFTVLSRCQRHDLRRIALTSVGERLAEICAAEGIEISTGALAAIAREGDGSMRDAQTLLDQIVAYSSGGTGGVQITDEIVAEILDLVDRNVLRSIVEACIDADPKTALELVARATEGGSEARRIADALLELLRDLVVLRVAPEGQGLFDGPDEERAELIELASRTEPARLRRMFRALVREIEDLSWAPQPTAVLELAVIRLATLPSGDDVGQLLSRLDQLERRMASGGGPPAPSGGGGGSASRGGPIGERASRKSHTATSPGSDAFESPPSPASSSPASSSSASSSPASSPASPSSASSPASPSPASSPASSPATAGPTPTSRPPVQAISPAGAGLSAQKASPAESSRIGTLDAARPSVQAASTGTGTAARTLGGGAPAETIFDRFRTRALEADRSQFASLEVAELVGIEGNTIQLGVSAAFHAERLKKRTDDLERLAGDLFGEPVRISVEVLSAQAHHQQTSQSREHSRKRRQEALNSESVNMAIEVLDAQIVEIRPLGENR